MDTDNFIIHVKTVYFYKDIADDVEKGFVRLKHKVDRPFPKWKNKKIIRLTKDELGGKIMIEFVALRPKAYPYLMDNGSEDKDKGTNKMCHRKRN